MGAALAEQATQAFKLITFVVIVVVVSLIITVNLYLFIIHFFFRVFCNKSSFTL